MFTVMCSKKKKKVEITVYSIIINVVNRRWIPTEYNIVTVSLVTYTYSQQRWNSC